MPERTQRDSRFLSNEKKPVKDLVGSGAEVLRDSNSGGDQGYRGQGEASYVAVIRAMWTVRVNSGY